MTPEQGDHRCGGGQVPDSVISSWKTAVGGHIICQIELYTVVLIRHQLAEWLNNRRSLFFIDNDAARFAIIKGRSPSESMCILAHLFHELDETAPTYWRIARVPSFSNPADAPSRGKGQEASSEYGAVWMGDLEHPAELLARIRCCEGWSLIEEGEVDELAPEPLAQPSA